MSVRTLTTALALAGVVLSGTRRNPPGPGPTLPHPSYAPFVIPGGVATPKPAHAARAKATPAPGALTDAEWRVAFCRTQDEVFALEFAVRNATGVGATKDLDAFRASIRTLDRRIDRARRSLVAVPARYATPLVEIELTMLRAFNRVTDLALQVLRTRSMSDCRALVDAGRVGDRQWEQMFEVNHRLQEGEHRLICL